LALLQVWSLNWYLWNGLLCRSGAPRLPCWPPPPLQVSCWDPASCYQGRCYEVVPGEIRGCYPQQVTGNLIKLASCFEEFASFVVLNLTLLHLNSLNYWNINARSNVSYYLDVLVFDIHINTPLILYWMFLYFALCLKNIFVHRYCGFVIAFGL